MRHAVLLIGIFFVLCMNVFAEEEAKKTVMAKDKEPAAEEKAKGRKHIDVNLPPGSPEEDGRADRGKGVMEPYQSYDGNTGLPNVVQSDKAGNLN